MGMSLTDILEMIARASNVVKEVEDVVADVIDTLNQDDQAEVNRRLQALKAQNDVLAESVSAKLDAASKLPD